MHAWPQEVRRGAATTVSGAHAVTAAGRLQGGQRKAAPTRPQSKGMRGSLAPWGLPLAPAVRSGERAAAGVSLARIERLRPGVQTPGRLLVGARTLRAVATRAASAGPHDVSVSPCPLPGAPAAAMAAWSSAGEGKIRQGRRGENASGKGDLGITLCSRMARRRRATRRYGKSSSQQRTAPACAARRGLGG